MEDFEAADCPMPEPFSAKVGVTLFIAWLFFLGFVTRIIFAPLMPDIEKELGISHAQAGSLFLMVSVGYLVAPFCSGFFSSKMNHRGNLTLSAWLVPLVLIPFGFVSSLEVMRLLMMAIGLAAGLHLPSAVATITAQIRKQDWGKALSIHQSAPPLSFVLAPLIAALLLNWISWRGVLLAWAGIALISALAFTFGGQGGDFPGRVPNLKNVKSILAKPSFYIMIVLFAMAMGGNAGIYAMLPLFLVNERGMDLASANTLIGLSQMTGLAMVFVSGWLSDRFGQKPTMAATLLAAGSATVLLGLLKGGWLVGIIFVQPAVLNSFFPSAFAALSRVAQPSLRSVINAMGPPISFLIGGGILPTVIGYMGETYSFSAGIVLAGAFMLAGPLLVLLVKLGQYDNLEGC